MRYYDQIHSKKTCHFATRLTGLSDALRARTATVAASGRETVAEQSFDAESGLRTDISRTDGETPVTTVSHYGLPVIRRSLSETDVWTYDAFGRTISKTGSLADVFRHRFSSKYYDEETRLYYYGKRFYRPVLMRWLNRDPIEEYGGNNIYAFCGNNAICNCDMEGCAYFAIRKLSYAPSIIKWSNFFTCPFWGIIADFAADYYNVEIAHEQLFYEDGGSPSSIGWSSKGYLRDELPAGYYRRGRSYNDCIMRIAESRVKQTHYQLTWFGNRTKCNCQDYADALRAMYHSIENDPDVKCQCKGSR